MILVRQTILNGISLEDYSDVHDFLDALSPRDPAWFPRTSDWIFRGQRDASWNLLPAAHRLDAPPFRYGANGWDRLPPLPKVLSPSVDPSLSVNDTKYQQLQHEMAPLRLFIEEVNRARLQLPAPSLTALSEYLLLAKDQPEILDSWPPPPLAGAVALAQHYGIPTRLLDWTERAVIAAYFAAIDSANRTDGDRGKVTTAPSLAVWGLSVLRTQRLLATAPDPSPRLRVVRVPAGSNARLGAQEGLFTVLDDKLPLESAFLKQLGLDEVVQSLAPTTESSAAPQTFLRRLALPALLAPRLLALLAEEFVTATQLFPGLDGAFRTVSEGRHWRDHDANNKRRPRV